MGFYEEFGDKLATSDRKYKARKALEKQLKTFDKRFQDGTFDVEVLDGDDTYTHPYIIQVTRKNFDKDVIIVFDNEGYGYKTMVTNEVSEFLHALKRKIQEVANVNFFKIRFR